MAQTTRQKHVNWHQGCPRRRHANAPEWRICHEPPSQYDTGRTIPFLQRRARNVQICATAVPQSMRLRRPEYSPEHFALSVCLQLELLLPYVQLENFLACLQIEISLACLQLEILPASPQLGIMPACLQPETMLVCLQLEILRACLQLEVWLDCLQLKNLLACLQPAIVLACL